jgi:O-antigen ligase
MEQFSMSIGLLAFGLNKKTRKYMFFFTTIIILYFVFNSEMIRPYLSKYEGLSSFQDVFYASSMEKRYTGWEAALNMFISHPATGVGIGRYSQEYLQYAPPVYSIWASGFAPLISAHDMYLTYLAETGIQGLLLIGLIFTIIVIRGFQLIKEGEKDDIFKFSLLIAIIVFLINNLVDGITFAYVKEIDKGIVFWSITAIIMSYDKVNKKYHAFS